MSVIRLAQNPRVLVLTFPDLAEQGRMLNRIAAFTEKAHLPRDKVLDDAALAAAIAASNDTPSTYYFAHDYRAADVVRFFETAERDAIVLNDAEYRLKRLIDAQGWTSREVVGALISVPNTGAAAVIDASARAALLRHELSHGEYFTDPNFAAAAQDWWSHRLTDGERKAVRAFLAAQDYDTTNADLVVNEAQAYLVETPDTRFFVPDDVKMAPERLAHLRADLVRAMPPGWLRDATPAPRRRRLTDASAPSRPARRRRPNSRRSAPPPRSPGRGWRRSRARSCWSSRRPCRAA